MAPSTDGLDAGGANAGAPNQVTVPEVTSTYSTGDLAGRVTALSGRGDPDYVDTALFLAHLHHMRDQASGGLVPGGFAAGPDGSPRPCGPVIPVQPGPGWMPMVDDTAGRALVAAVTGLGADPELEVARSILAYEASLAHGQEAPLPAGTPFADGRLAVFYRGTSPLVPPTLSSAEHAFLDAMLARAERLAREAGVGPDADGDHALELTGEFGNAVAAHVWHRHMRVDDDLLAMDRWRGWVTAAWRQPSQSCISVRTYTATEVGAGRYSRIVASLPIPPRGAWEEWSGLLDRPDVLARALETYARLAADGSPLFIAASAAPRLA